MSDKNKEIIRKVNEAFREGNFEGFLDFCTDNVQWTIVGEHNVKGKETIRQWMSDMAKENPEPPKFSVVDPVIGEGDFVVTRGEMSMKDKDGRPGHYTYCDIYRFQGDRIAELNSFVVKTEAKGKTSGAS